MKKTVDLQFTVDYKGANVKREYEGNRFQHVLAKGGVFELVEANSVSQLDPANSHQE